jgi:hypothetical protein
MMKGGEFSYNSDIPLVPYMLIVVLSSRNAKADPLVQPRRGSSPSVYAAEMEDFKNGYPESDEDEDEDEA